MKPTFNLKQLVRANVLQMKPYSSARDEYKDASGSMVFLDANENPFPSETHRYPDPHQNALKKKFSEIYGIPVENLVLGNGSDEVLDLLFRAFCEPKQDEIITLPPTYGMYKVLAELNEVTNKEILLKPNFQPDVKGIKALITTKTKMIFICSPNNPTGNLIADDAIIEVLNSFNGLVIIDEAYIHFTQNQSWASRLNKYPNLVVIQTLSKAYGQAGIRLGICIAAAEVCDILKKIKPPYNVNQLTQTAALVALEQHQKYMEQSEQVISERILLQQSLEQLHLIKEIIPSEANFLLCRVDDANKRYQELIEMGIVVRNRSSQARCKNTLRFTVGTPSENQQLIKALQKIDENE